MGFNRHSTRTDAARALQRRETDKYNSKKDIKAHRVPGTEFIYGIYSGIKKEYPSMSYAEKCAFWTILLAIPGIAGYAAITYWDELRDTALKEINGAKEKGAKSLKKVRESAGAAEMYLAAMANEPPTADFFIETPLDKMISGNAIVFNAGKSRDPEGAISRYIWHFRKDNGPLRNETTDGPVLKKNLEPGEYRVMLAVEDGMGKVSKRVEQKFFVAAKNPQPRTFTPGFEIFGEEEYKSVVAANITELKGTSAEKYVAYFLEELHEGEENDTRQIGHPERLFLPKRLLSASNLVHVARHAEQNSDGFVEKTVRRLAEKYGLERVREDHAIKEKMHYILEKDAVKKQVAWEKEKYRLTDEAARKSFRAYMEQYKIKDPEEFASDFPEAAED